jgi:hypothetical protein
MSKAPRRARGFSSAEMLAGIVLTLVLVMALYSFQRVQIRALAKQNMYSDSQNATRTVLEMMTRELRMASYDPTLVALPVSPGPVYPGVRRGIVEATATRLHFQQDLNGDGVIGGAAGPGEDVTYDVAGDALQRTEGGAAPVTVASGVPANGLSFRYFDGGNPPVELVPSGDPPALTVGQRDGVAKVRVTVRADVTNPGQPHPVTSVAESEVAIRSRSLDNF